MCDRRSAIPFRIARPHRSWAALSVTDSSASSLWDRSCSANRTPRLRLGESMGSGVMEPSDTARVRERGDGASAFISLPSEGDGGIGTGDVTGGRSRTGSGSSRWASIDGRSEMEIGDITEEPLGFSSLTNTVRGAGSGTSSELTMSTLS